MPYKILIADDNGPLRLRIRSLLEEQGFEICGEASNGRGAIEKVAQLGPDLVILNISMPVMNGIDALPEILRRRPNIKVVIFTLDESAELKQYTLRLGAHSFVSKSAHPDELIAEVKRLLKPAAAAN